MKPSAEFLDGLRGRFDHAVIAFVGQDGYPLAVATGFRVESERGVVVLDGVAGDEVQPPEGERVNVVFSHIRPQPGVGYDERRYVSLWGELRRSNGHLELMPQRSQHWDEEEMSFFEFSERGVPQARRYFDQVSAETGRDVRPRLSFGWLFLRATRLPFLSATIVPVLLGIAVAALRADFNWWLAALTLVGAVCIHLAANVANDVFDTLSGADEANVNPTQFSGGSRVILYGLVRLRSMALLCAGFFAAGIGIGLGLAATRGWSLLWVGVAGALISLFYTAPPLRLVHRGLGELSVGIGFGPIMALGAYFVQAEEYAREPLLASLPVGILIGLILYVNEVPDRAADALAGKRTLPVRLSEQNVVRGYDLAVALAFGIVAALAISGLVARPAIIALAALPLAFPVRQALRDSYGNPYTLMPAMAKNIQLHLVAGLLLVTGYVIAIVADAALDDPPFFLS